MPVRVKPQLKTLWVVTTGMHGHEPYTKLFKQMRYLQDDSKIEPGDVIFFDGGTDVNSQLYGEKAHIGNEGPDHQRDELEIAAFERGKKAGAKFLGTCRGAQLLLVLSGGKLVQHVTGHYSGGHLLFTGEGSKPIWTESSHHQVMWPYEINHVLIGWADPTVQAPFKAFDEYGKEFEGDLYPEIVYCKDTRALCIQGHSEWVADSSEFRKLTLDLVTEFLLTE